MMTLNDLRSSKPHLVIANVVEQSLKDKTDYYHFATPTEFVQGIRGLSSKNSYGDSGLKAWDSFKMDDKGHDKIYEDVAKKVKNALHARGFTTKMLYGDVEFTTQNTGIMSKQRALMGRRDCYYMYPGMDDGKLFHDLYISLAYPGYISDSTIRDNSYAVLALCTELARLIPMRVFVVNHVKHKTATADAVCYSYCIKQFRQPITPKEFKFFTGESKRTLGWQFYNPNMAMPMTPKGTVSISNFNLEKEIDTIWKKLEKVIKVPKTNS